MGIRMTKNLRYTAAPFAIGLALAAAPSAAQTANESEPTGVLPAQADQAPATTGAIVVTGSRIQNPNLEAASPVAVVTEDEIQLQQVNTVEEFVRQIPGVVPSVGSNVNNGNGGSTYLNLRGLGANRNLVLLNGTRLVPQGLNGLTNVDVIPVALLDRTDLLTGGAGATYGADAISGVVNFITKRDFSGIDLSATEQLTEEGDGNLFRTDLVVGGNFADDRGNAVLAIGYTDRDAIFQGDRDYGFNNISSISGNAGGSSTTVPTVITVPGTTGGTLQVSPGGNSLQPFYSPFNFNPFNIYQTPLEQYRIYGSSNYRVTDNIEVFGEGMFVQSTTSTVIAPSGTFRNVLTTPLSNPFLNAGIRNQICGLDTSGTTAGVQRLFSQAECNAAALATDPNDPNYRTVDLDYGRRFVEFGPRLSEYRTRLFQFKAGVRGNITSNVDFEVFGAYGESENRQRQSGNGTLSRLQQSVLSTNPNTCLDTSNSCVPINLFGPLGSLTPAVQSFLDVGNSSTESATLGQFQAFVNGDFGLTVPSASSPISFAAGFEYRDYYAESRSDLLSQTPGEVLGNGAAAPDTEGSYDVYEFFGELNVPLISDRPFFENVSIDLAARQSQYSTTGSEFTWKAGGNYSPFRGLEIRGGYQEVTRAPNLGELFAVATTGLDNFSADPCAGAAPLSNATLRATCLAQGAPAGSIGNIIVDPAGQVNVTTGGNPNLDAENAYTWTIGAIVQPSFLPRFSLTVDYYNIVLRDAITSPTIGDVFGACFGPNLTGAGSATDPACTSIRRNPATGNLFGSVATTPGLPLVLTNQGRLATDGIDLVMNWSKDFGDAALDLSFFGNWTNHSRFQANQNDPTSINRDCVGYYSINCGSIQPEFSFQQRTTLSLGDADISLRWRFVDAVEVEPSEASNFLEDFRSIPSEHYFDLTTRFVVQDNFTFTIAAINLFDNEPKLVGSNIGSTSYNSGNVYPSTYDALGRRYSATARITF